MAEVVSQLEVSLFERVVAGHQGERYVGGPRRWDQFVAMLFCQPGLAQNLALMPQLPVSAKPPLSAPAGLPSLDSTIIDLCAEVFDWRSTEPRRAPSNFISCSTMTGCVRPHYDVITEGN